MLFFCKWGERASVLIDARDEAHAYDLATKIGESAPVKVRALPPGVVAFEAAWEEDEDDPDQEVFVVDAFDHVLELLERLEEDEGCTSEAEADGGAVVQCAREKHDDGKHRANGLEW